MTISVNPTEINSLYPFFNTACRKNTMPAPARIPANTHQFNEMAFSVSYCKMDVMNAFCSTEEVVRNRQSIKNRNNTTGNFL